MDLDKYMSINRHTQHLKKAALHYYIILNRIIYTLLMAVFYIWIVNINLGQT